MARPTMLLSVAAVLGAAGVRADGLADARACLAALPARAPIRATVTVEVRPLADPKAAKDAPKPEPARLAVEAAAEGGSITVTASSDLLAALRRERDGQREGKKRSAALGSALNEARVDALASRLDAGTGLAATLAGATLVREGPDAASGAGARRLVLQPASEFDEAARKHVKNLKEELKVWLDADGCPVASEMTVEGKFRFMVFSAEFRTHWRTEYARVGDRLVVVREEREESGEAMGERQRDATTVTLTPHAAHE